jgi:formate dehydrogenase subunit gamma
MINSVNSKNPTIERFRKRTIVLHWVHTGAFLILAVTGAIMLLQEDVYSNIYIAQILHRAAAVIFITVPVLGYFMAPRSSAGFIKESLKFGSEDVKWIVAAPDYYFGGREEGMPPQGRLNSGQKFWQSVVIFTGLIFVITGIPLWVFRFNLPVSAYEWILFVHGIAFVIVFVVFLLHIYLALFHPRFKESISTMINGRISSTYARTHYRKWYEKQP